MVRLIKNEDWRRIISRTVGDHQTSKEQTNKQEGPRINQEITASQVRLISETGEMVGVVSLSEALLRASKVGLDLVEVSPLVEPPVCKILDNGKYKYDLQKKKAEAKKRQKSIEIKEIQIGPLIGANDFDVKKRAALRFIDEGNKVKVVMRFKGRQISHPEIGMEVINRFQTALEVTAKAEVAPKLEGKQIIMVLAPK